jgi:thioredoxin-related protein
MKPKPVHAPARRSALALAASLLFVRTPLRAQGRETPLPTPASLAAAAKEAAARGEPLVLLVSLPGCPYCELVRRNYLAPMRAQGLVAFQITVNDRQTVVLDFNGAASTGAAIASAYKARFTPTLLFLNPRGEEIAERIKGMSSVDFYGAYLDAQLATARKALQI